MSRELLNEYVEGLDDSLTDNAKKPWRRRRKDRKRWCGGHVGREHDYSWVAHHNGRLSTLKCSKCTRAKDWCYRHGPACEGPCRCGLHNPLPCAPPSPDVPSNRAMAQTGKLPQ